MAKSHWSHALVWASLAGTLAGCGTVPENQAPRLQSTDLVLKEGAGNGELVPRAESPSRSGNPGTYVVSGRRYRVKETSAGYREQGIASWYGRRFHGRKTSSGPRYNMFDLTAAHKSLPIPTYVRVTNLENGRNVVVKVNDRGPFVSRRIIDLSYAAATRLDMLGRGTAQVEVVALEPYQSLPSLAARRAEGWERLASRQIQPEPKSEPSTIRYAHQEPARSELAVVGGDTPARQTITGSIRSESESKVEPAPIQLARLEPREPETPVVDTPSPRLASAAAVKRTASRPRVPARLAGTVARTEIHSSTRPEAAQSPGKAREQDRSRSPIRLASAEPASKAKKAVEGHRGPASSDTKASKPNSGKAATGRNPAKASDRGVGPARRDQRAEPGVENRKEARAPARNAGATPSTTPRLASLKAARSRVATD